MNTETVIACKGRRVQCADGRWIIAPDITITKDEARRIQEQRANNLLEQSELEQEQSDLEHFMAGA